MPNNKKLGRITRFTRRICIVNGVDVVLAAEANDLDYQEMCVKLDCMERYICDALIEHYKIPVKAMKGVGDGDIF